MNVDHTKGHSMFDGIGRDLLPDEIGKTVRSFLKTENLYLSATRKITTKMENLNDESVGAYSMIREKTYRPSE